MRGKSLAFPKSFCYNTQASGGYADVAELADASDLGSDIFDVGVQIPSSAPKLICGSGSVVERCLAKANVASSNLVFRSISIFSSVGRAPDS